MSSQPCTPLLQSRFRCETETDGTLGIVAPAQRSAFVILFLVVWLGGWTVGGVHAIAQMMDRFQPFLAFWLCGWALGEAFVLASLCWMAAGREVFRVARGDLAISLELFGLARRRLYRGADVRDLSASSSTLQTFRGQMFDMPLLWAPRSGGVEFTYGARKVYAGLGLDEAEGRAIVDLLKSRLPKTA